MPGKKTPPALKSRPRTALRRRAAAQLRAAPADVAAMRPAEVRALVHELRVHQVELEIQNEELRQAQLELAQSRDRFADLYGFAPVGYVTVRLDGKILAGNLAAADLWGLTRQALTRHKITDFVDRAAQDDFFRHRQCVHDSPLKQICELAMHKSDGTPLFVRLESLRQGSAPDFQCAISLIDLTSRHQAELELAQLNRDLERRVQDRTALLREHEQRLELALSATQLGLWDRDIPSGKLLVDDRWAAILGFRPDELEPLTQAWLDRVYPEDLPAVQKAMDDLLAGLIPRYAAEFRMKAKDGSWKWIESHGQIAASDPSGRPLRVIGTHRDITIRRESQERVKLYERDLRSLAHRILQIEESERRRLASDLHDGVSQILAAIRMKLDLLLKGAAPPDLKGHLRDIDALLAQALHEMQTLTFELFPPMLRDLGLPAAARWLADDIQRRFGLAVRVAEAPLIPGVSDSAKAILFRCLRELLVNVAKHAHAREVSVDFAQSHQNLTLVVADDGRGFDQGCAPQTLVRESGRGGFGLFSIRERLEHLGGSLEIHSQPGRGSTVRVTLPLSSATIDEAPENSP